MKTKIPSLCYWCGDQIGETDYEGEKPLAKAITSYEPCKACRDKFSSGVAIFETRKEPYYSMQPPLFMENKEKDTEVFPSGRWVILPPEAISAIFEDPAAAEFRRTRNGYVDEEVFRLIQGQGAGEQPTQH